MQKTFPAPSVLQVRPTFKSQGTFSLYWVVKDTNLGIPVGNDLTLPHYPTAESALASTTGWSGPGYCHRKPAAIVNVPLDNLLHRVSK